MQDLAAWRAEIAADQRAKVIIDDDPTGTQAVSDVDVILRPDRATFDEFLASAQPAVFVLSNSRAFAERPAVELVGGIARAVDAAARDAGRSATLILRGDSTLRGHVVAEVEAVAPHTPVLFVPAFLDGGRFTRDGIHYLRTATGAVPVADTEFARDPVFGYRSGTLADWVREVSGGRRHAVPVPLARLRAHGPDAVADALLGAGPDAFVIPDCVREADLLAIAAGLVRAQNRGARVVVRCAASLAAALAGLSTRPLDRIPLPPPGRVLVACGSFTAASTRQLRALGGLWDRRVEIPASAQRGDDALLAGAVRERLQQDGHALLASDRAPSHDRIAAAPELLMDTLVATVRRLAAEVDLVVAKGGITSARLATDALGASGAWVRGQIRPGVPVRRLRTPQGAPSYVVVPGNVGTDSTLRDILDRITTDPDPRRSLLDQGAGR
ncbi:four-carbon acid sugar kinase family protein [Micromonospora soli]|uniref:four-carbon acid sugar kinase family protein n=1 Tax=Micromonospora sp. NBRC 110009 TaxID=3061627 RepID=UPI00267261FF|nr:four-carbon acid sugar kinase family protein [Micromonospora sp. NBRC 110009]WKT99201.1 four-carbon acid sugar kinase family protein [Micromonospora sp. NBRC 110009]